MDGPVVGWAGLGLTRPWWTGLVGGPTLNEYKHWKDQNDFHFSVSSYQNKNGGGKKCVQTAKPCNSYYKKYYHPNNGEFNPPIITSSS